MRIRSVEDKMPCIRPVGVSEEVWNTRVAAGKAITLFAKHERGFVSIDRGSVYGAALAMPQVARSTGWSLSYTGFMLRGYIFLVLNLALQGFLLYMLSKEERIMVRFAGQPHLCDFGAQLRNCPGAPNCLGPGGTSFTSTRLYDWDLWSTRIFVRDSLKALFPDKAGEIDAKVDPGEYGVESYYLRVCCCFIFVLGLWPDLMGSFEMARLLYAVPSEAKPWLAYEVPLEDDGSEQTGTGDLEELNWIKFKVAGMPLHWKAFNASVVLFPKMYLWLLTVDIGIIFLLETSAIEDMIINAVALAFILAIDETLNSSLVDHHTREILTKFQDYPLFDETSIHDVTTDRHAYDFHTEDRQWTFRSVHFYAELVPPRFIAAVMTTAFFIYKYYVQNCERGPDGGLISGPVHPPTSGTLTFASFFFGPWPDIVPVDVEESVTLWRMPDV